MLTECLYQALFGPFASIVSNFYDILSHQIKRSLAHDLQPDSHRVKPLVQFYGQGIVVYSCICVRFSHRSAATGVWAVVSCLPDFLPHQHG